MRRVTSFLLILIIISGMILCPCSLERMNTVLADTDLQQNTWNNCRSRYSSPSRSYIVPISDGGYMIFQVPTAAGADYTVRYYDSDLLMVSSVNVPQELERFGTFTYDSDNYYILTGQNNPDESPDVECFRITKYDKSWNRIASCGLYDCNTTGALAASNSSMVISGNDILVRAGHTMYTSADGLRHQAVMTIHADKDQMKILKSYNQVAWGTFGYVSHSFAQCLRTTDDDHVVAADLGDAYPRAIVVSDYASPSSDIEFPSQIPTSDQTQTALISIPGKIGDNNTGFSLGGLEVSDDNYIVAGCAEPGIIAGADSANNIFIGTVSRADHSTNVKWIGYDQENEGTTIYNVPFLVKVNDNLFAVIWSARDAGTIHYRFIDGKGNYVSEEYSKPGALSDCQPVYDGDKIVWYYVQDTKLTFCFIDPADMTCYEAAETPKGVNRSWVAAFCERLYTCALDRSSDPEGKQDWINRILMGSTGASVAEGFLYSPEFLGKNMSNSDFLEVLYKVFFDRASDPYGKADWLNRMENGWTKQSVIRGFIDSTEWANVCLSFGIESGGNGVPNLDVEPNDDIIAFATRLYTTCLGRDADPAGLMDWARRLANRKITGTEAAHGFFFSNEFLEHNYSDDEFIKRLYRTFMGREFDETGYLYWMERIEFGASREEVFRGFADSSEFGVICSTYGILR